MNPSAVKLITNFNLLLSISDAKEVKFNKYLLVILT